MGVLFLGFFRHWDGCVLPVLLVCSDDVFTDNTAGVRGWDTAISQKGRSEVDDSLLLRGWVLGAGVTLSINHVGSTGGLDGGREAAAGALL